MLVNLDYKLLFPHVKNRACFSLDWECASPLKTGGYKINCFSHHCWELLLAFKGALGKMCSRGLGPCMGEGAAGGWPTLLARPWLCSCPTEERPRGQGRSGAADNLAASLVSLVRGAQDLLGTETRLLGRSWSCRGRDLPPLPPSPAWRVLEQQLALLLLLTWCLANTPKLKEKRQVSCRGSAISVIVQIKYIFCPISWVGWEKNETTQDTIFSIFYWRPYFTILTKHSVLKSIGWLT